MPWIDTADIKEQTDNYKDYINSSGASGSSLLGTIFFNRLLLLGVDASDRVTNYPYEFMHHKSTFDIVDQEQVNKLKISVLEDDNSLTLDTFL